METLRGTVTKIKILKYLTDGTPLVRFSVDGVSCLIARHSLNFLYQVEEGSDLVICGSYNSRNQFVVSKFCVMAKNYA